MAAAGVRRRRSGVAIGRIVGGGDGEDMAEEGGKEDGEDRGKEKLEIELHGVRGEREKKVREKRETMKKRMRKGRGVEGF